MWKKIASKEVHKNPFFSVDEDEVIKPDGNPGLYYIVRPRHGVAVAAFNGEKLLLVNQFRYPVGKRVWSFVAGGAEGEDYLEDAKRELAEEAGFSAAKWTKLGEFPNSPSITNQSSILYLAEDLSEGEKKLEAGELDMEHEFFSFEEMHTLIQKGELSAFDIADFYLVKNFLETRN